MECVNYVINSQNHVTVCQSMWSNFTIEIF